MAPTGRGSINLSESLSYGFVITLYKPPGMDGCFPEVAGYLVAGPAGFQVRVTATETLP